MLIPRILIIAGSDSGGGAGIQADIKTVTMLGGHAMTAITAITAQNTLGVQAVHMVPTEIVLAQIESCVSDIGVDAVKIGMIGSAETANAVADRLAALDVSIVFDPVMVATSGSVLADAATIAAFERLTRIATLVTPNFPELAALHATLSPVIDKLSPVRAEPVEALPFSCAVDQEDSASTSSARTGIGLAAAFDTAVLVKGGHTDTADVTDILYAPDGEIARWSAPRIHTTSTHGTGCTLASAIATGLGQGMALPEAIERAIRFVRRALEAAPGLGQGHGPMGQQSVTDFQ
ncbi:hydroxymethylpyrimidine/phosphomethylpyrimidine kinase [Sphingomonas sp. Leaf357]|uniref:hydroxymethylpyrimidine/phosphomethylpyrimidine kinase family protein n=1 Tax=Sphingomonas sp. Leaf357 TaxID=1736350 RepID=UPI0006F360A1|nr:bifunctional hydroxymethylpyrimidine kinase/phosphomethylpyrimidine kinase [Sphingomonas sp. Leaf357]KQS05059.1 hydroxymethylpyrimidine/phosphomethylpyrimidine kinase [Sphingomonas sp. Leaf357]